MPPTGQIVILNGAPRSGKSSIAEAMVGWENLGVDRWMREHTPDEFRPGIGLRPGGERPDLESFIQESFRDFYKWVGAAARSGQNVVADIGFHRWYAQPFDPFSGAMRAWADLPVLVVGVRCPIETIMARRNAGGDGYAKGTADVPIPAPVQRWQDAVHEGKAYDLEVDTSVLTPQECVALILAELAG